MIGRLRPHRRLRQRLCCQRRLLPEYSRQSTIDSLKIDCVTDGYYTVVSKNSGAWVAVANMNHNSLEEMALEVVTILLRIYDESVSESITLR